MSCTKSTTYQGTSNAFTRDTTFSYETSTPTYNYPFTASDCELVATVVDADGSYVDYTQFSSDGPTSNPILHLKQQICIKQSTVSVLIKLRNRARCTEDYAYIRSEYPLYEEVVLQ